MGILFCEYSWSNLTLHNQYQTSVANQISLILIKAATLVKYILLIGDSGKLIPCAGADEAWQMWDSQKYR